MKNKILKETLKIMIFASILSSLGGFGLEVVKDKLLIALPLIIVLPAFAGMVGDSGIVFVSKITTLYNMKKISKPEIRKSIRNLFWILLLIAFLSAFYIAFLSLFVSYLKGFYFNLNFAFKTILVVLLTALSIGIINFLVALFGLKYAIKRNIDPDDLLIPISTSIADFGSFVVFSILVYLIF